MDREQSISYAKKYLEDTLSFFGLNIEIKASADDEVIELKVPSTHLNGFLIGHNGDTLRSLQFLVSTTLRNHDAGLSRINIDIADYKAQRADRLVSKIKKDILETVQKNGQAYSLEPMSAADRRVVHQAVGEYADLETHSEGEGRERHIIISKK